MKNIKNIIKQHFEYLDCQEKKLHILHNTPEKKIIFSKEESLKTLPLLGENFTKKHWVNKHLRTQGQIPELGIYIFDNCYVCHSGWVLSQEKKIYYSEDIINTFALHKITQRIDNPKNNNILARFLHETNLRSLSFREISDECVLLTKPGFRVYGHWLLDILPMIWLLKKNDFWSLKNNPNLKFLLPQDTPGWALNILNLFGIDRSSLLFYNHQTEILKIQRLYLPSCLRINHILSPQFNKYVEDVYQNYVNQVKHTTNKNYPKKVFISRINLESQKTNLVNYQEILTVLKKNNIESISPEKLDWTEQVYLFSNANLVIGEFGSGLHNTIFSPSATNTIVLASPRMNWIQSGISALRNQKIAYIKPKEHTKIKNQWRYSYSPELLDSYLAQINVTKDSC